MNTEMQIINVVPGSPAWHAHRQNSNNASDVPAAKGVSPYTTRSELLRRRATGIIPEVDPATQRRFDDGHAAEAAARPFAEKIIGEELFPATGVRVVDGIRLSASFDGLTMMGRKIFECKLWNEKKAAFVRDGMIPPQDHGQVIQQLVVSKADACLYMVSDGTEERTVHTWVSLQDGDEKDLLSMWRQFEQDLAAYEHADVIPAAVAEPQMALPAVFIQVNGSIALTDNLTVFGDALTAYVERINKKPETDNDFATLEATVKTLKAAEEALDAAENSALGQAASIDTMRRAVAMYRSMARDNRLMFEKVVKQEKINRKAAIINQGSTALAAHITGLNNRLGASYMPSVPGGFVEAVAGLKSLDSMRDKVATALANAKITANEIADRIEANRNSLLIGTENDSSHLFPDFAMVCTKLREDFAALHAMRIQQEEVRKEVARKAAKDAEDARIAAAVEAERKAGEARAAAEVERIRKEEADRGQLTQENDQGGKSDAGSNASGEAADVGSIPQPVAASTPPTPEEKRAVLVEAGDDVRAYLNTLDLGDKEFGRMRAVLMGYEQFKARRHPMAAAA